MRFQCIFFLEKVIKILQVYLLFPDKNHGPWTPGHTKQEANSALIHTKSICQHSNQYFEHMHLLNLPATIKQPKRRMHFNISAIDFRLL